MEMSRWGALRAAFAWLYRGECRECGGAATVFRRGQGQVYWALKACPLIPVLSGPMR